MRTGAALAAAVVEAAKRPKGRADSNAGRAKQAPNPRRKWRRVKLACRSASRLGFSTEFVFMLLMTLRDWSGFTAGNQSFTGIRRHIRGAHSHFLEGRRLHDAHQQS